jgi:pimeloyl-ACP methyl ester carboxylesterase
LRWQTASTLFPSLAARAFERQWFRLPAGPLDAASAACLAQARTDWALVTGHGTSRRVRVYRWGQQGPAVLLAHGWGGHAGQWHALVPALVAAGHRVVAFDALSHGASDDGALGPGRSSVVEMSRALLAAAWHAGPVQAVVAHSLGGAATALAIREGIPLQAVVMIGPPADMHSASASLAWQLGIGPGVLARMQRNSEQWLGMPWSAFNVPDIGRARAVPPTLVVHDRHDKEVRWEDGAAIAGAWPGARLLTTEGLGHRRILRDAEVIAGVAGFVGERTRAGVA